jgi:hypothetical protein
MFGTAANVETLLPARKIFEGSYDNHWEWCECQAIACVEYLRTTWPGIAEQLLDVTTNSSVLPQRSVLLKGQFWNVHAK